MKDYQKIINRSHLNSIANKTLSKNHFQKLQIYELMLYLMYYDAVVYSALFITCAWMEFVVYFSSFRINSTNYLWKLLVQYITAGGDFILKINYLLNILHVYVYLSTTKLISYFNIRIHIKNSESKPLITIYLCSKRIFENNML